MGKHCTDKTIATGLNVALHWDYDFNVQFYFKEHHWMTVFEFYND